MKIDESKKKLEDSIVPMGVESCYQGKPIVTIDRSKTRTAIIRSQFQLEGKRITCPFCWAELFLEGECYKNGQR